MPFRQVCIHTHYSVIFLGGLSENDATRTKRFSRLYCRLANKSLKLLFFVPFFFFFAHKKKVFFFLAAKGKMNKFCTENLLTLSIRERIDTNTLMILSQFFSILFARGKFSLKFSGLLSSLLFFPPLSESLCHFHSSLATAFSFGTFFLVYNSKIMCFIRDISEDEENDGELKNRRRRCEEVIFMFKIFHNKFIIREAWQNISNTKTSVHELNNQIALLVISFSLAELT